MGRSPCCEKVGLKKGPWTPEEDQKLLAYIERHSQGSWRALPAKAGLERCGKSCRLRWTNYLRPDIKRGKFSLQEEQTIIQLHALLGNRWSAIARHLPKRTDNEIKNYWNTHLKKRLTKMGIDPVTHKRKSNAFGSDQSKDIATLNHIAQWESARLEAEVRLARESKLVMSNPYHHPISGSSSSAQPLNKAAVPLPPLKQPMIPPCLDILKACQGVWTKPNALFTSNIGSLESPTSTLHFSDNVFTVLSTGLGENSAFRTSDKVENSKPNAHSNWKCSEKPNEKVEVGDQTDKGLLLDEVGSFPIDVACIADSLELPSFTESFAADLDDADVYGITGLYDNLGTCYGGNLEDNKKYWNTIF